MTFCLVALSTRVRTGGSSRNVHDPLLFRSATFGINARLSVCIALARVFRNTAFDFGSALAMGFSLPG